jgi:hypothetical protein
MEKFDSLVDRAVDEALYESLKRREREAIENIKFILSHYAAEEDEEGDEDYSEDYAGDEPEDAGDWYGEDEFDEDDNDWLYDEDTEGYDDGE